LQTEKREHDATKRELSETKEKMKELLRKAEITDEKVGSLQLELKRFVLILYASNHTNKIVNIQCYAVIIYIH
jgi:hypothetical protein